MLFPRIGTRLKKFQDVEKEVIAAVLGQGLLESERLVHLLDDFKIRPEAPPKITVQVQAPHLPLLYYSRSLLRCY